MIKIAVLYCTLVGSSILSAQAQIDTLNWINKNAYPLKADTALSLNDLAFLSSALKGNMVLGLGEASHGTREFYNQKRRIIEYLTTKLKYRNVGFEFSDLTMEPINQYVINGKGDLKELMKDMRLYNTKEIYGIFQFLKQFNEHRSQNDKVSLFGFDRAAFAGDPFTRDEKMAGIIVQNNKSQPRKTIIWAHNVHIAKDTTMARFNAMGCFLKQHFGERYYAIGFDTFKGSVNVLDDRDFVKYDFMTGHNSYSRLFAGAMYENFFITFQKPGPFFGIKNNITNIYSNWVASRMLPIKAGVDFDAILFLRLTNASVELR